MLDGVRKRMIPEFQKNIIRQELVGFWRNDSGLKMEKENTSRAWRKDCRVILGYMKGASMT